jgi:NADH dehydrogenase
MSTEGQRHRIVVVGGGAGGLELASKLGRKLGRKGLAEVTLVDDAMSHIWKPLLHEVAAGTLFSNVDDLEYLAQGHWNHFRFRLGRMHALDRERKVISLQPSHDESGFEYIAARDIPYDTLIMAVGSTTNDFGIEGVREHCFFLDTREQADRFHQTLLRRCLQAHTQEGLPREGQLHVAIAGAGATGVELTAELHESTRQLVAYGLDRITPERDIKLTIIEASDRILPALPERLVNATVQALKNIGVDLLTGEKVVKATADGFHTASGKFIPAATKVWAAGIRAPEFLANLAGLESNRINQLVVRPTLQTTRDDNIFAIGDCASCPLPDGKGFVPPRAQSAHQQADLLVKAVRARLKGESLPEYRYVDYGSLVNLSRYSTVGSLMGNLLGRYKGNLMIEGIIARLMYRSLYKMHQVAVQGYLRVGLLTTADILTRRSRPRMKLH